ncbi:MAG TPA: PhzF family phenazine biosynthesis protein, partial [Usitatibacteraceae bacterium]|nr:PhzF family phenazine biosynthesis protein [Usitatibacteraceae bacterium]
MRTHAFRLVNVFAESTFGGNPLCVFESGSGLSDAEMQALALQFNLSETTFLLPSQSADARVRIFTPGFEMAFAGHPTLGSAHVARSLGLGSDALRLEMKAGIIPVRSAADRWTLTANAPSIRPAEWSGPQLSAMLGLDAGDVLPGARWVDTGSEQLIVPLADAAAVRRAAPQREALLAVASNIGRSMAYVFAREDRERIVSRFFFIKHSGLAEDPGTGSATANLGGWL